MAEKLQEAAPVAVSAEEVDHRAGDPRLLEMLAAMRPQTFSGAAWRVTGPDRDPLAGGTDGDRWHPPESFPALYTSLEPDGALAEIYHHLSSAPVHASSDMRLHRLRVRARRVLALSDLATLEGLGIDETAFRNGDYARSREVGAAARRLGHDALIVPCALWPCANLVLFPDRLQRRDALRATASRQVNWPAWRERAGAPGPGRATKEDRLRP